MQSISPSTLIDPGTSLNTAAEVLAAIEARILRGDLEPGERLPPVRTAASEFGLAPNTVAAAYRRLTERGLAHGEGRRGTFVADRPSGEHLPKQAARSGLIDLASGNPDPELLPDLHAALQNISAAHVAYGNDPIDNELAALLSAELSAELQPETPFSAGKTLAVVGGALDGIERVLMAHLRPGDRVAVEDPGYPSVLNLVKALSLRPVPMAIDNQGPTEAGLVAALDAGAQAVVLTPRAQNPTGAAVTETRAMALTEILVTRPDILVIEDDHAGPIAGANHRSVVSDETMHWAVIRSVAKSLGPDLRLAGLVGDETTVSRVINRQLLGTGWTSHILQRTTAALLQAETSTDRFERGAAVYKTRRQKVLDTLHRRGMEAWGATGLNVWVPVNDEAYVVSGMQHRGFAVLAGTRFRQQSPPAIRLSTGSTQLNTLADAANALADLLDAGPLARSA